MIIAIDTETRGLDATKYITGCLITERNPEKPEIYDKKEELWQRILELGVAENRRGKTLQVYAHNHQYDFYAYANLQDPNIKWFSHSPFINAYTDEYKKEYIKFLDTMAIYPMSLAKMAKLHNMEKSETPNVLKTGKMPTKSELKKIKEYMIQDTRIVLQTVLNLKNLLKTEGIKVKRLYTINQIAINYLINQWRQQPENKHLFWNPKSGELHKTWKPDIIHEAYRGGRVQAHQTGKFEQVTTIDINSLYPWSATQISFPLLKEMKFKRNTTPTKEENIGIIRCMLYNKNNELGLLPIRTPNGSYYPTKGQYLIGTWTLEEYQLAIKEGYQLIYTDWTYTYKEAPNNPFKQYMEKLYQKRIANHNEHDKYFYKQMMNSAIGKLAQNKTQQEIIIDSVEKTQEYLEKNYKIMRGIDYNYVYKKDIPTKPKKYYCPILPTLINAKARITLYQELKKIPKEDLLYCDTDSITLKNWDKHKHKFTIGQELGQFKIEQEGVNCEIIARKTYQLGDQIKISGIHKNDEQLKEWKTGIITDSKMQTINTTKKPEELGRFKTETRNLIRQNTEHLINQGLLKEEKILIDENINTLTNYIPHIQKIMK